MLLCIQARAGEPEGTPEDIMEMVKREISPPHRYNSFVLSIAFGNKHADKLLPEGLQSLSPMHAVVDLQVLPECPSGISVSVAMTGLQQHRSMLTDIAVNLPCRLILFLQQASVEWCSSLWMHVVQDVDPHCQRTVIVSSKFDNRVKEFAERWEVCPGPCLAIRAHFMHT